MTTYLALLWHSIGRSYGGIVMGLRVVDARGRHIHLGLALLRAAFCVAFPLGVAWVAVSRANRSVQDVVLRTSVIYDWDAIRLAPVTRRAGEQDAKQPVDVDIGQMDEAAEEDQHARRNLGGAHQSPVGFARHRRRRSCRRWSRFLWYGDVRLMAGYFHDGDRAAGIFGVLATGFSVLLGS